MAGGTLGSLVVALEANVAQFEAAMSRAQYVANQMERGVTASISKVDAAIAGFAAGAADKVFQKISEAINDLGPAAIAAAAGLERLRETVGGTAEQWSAIAGAAKLSGTSFDSLQTGAEKLAKSMASSRDTSAGAGLAFAQLGVKVRDAQGNLRSTDDVMVDIAKALDGFADGAGKAAAMQLMFGRAGAQLLPVMKDMAAAGDLVGKVTNQQAREAEDYEKDLKRLQATKEALVRTIALELVPVMDDIVKAFLKASNETGGFRDIVSGLAKDGSIRQWAEDAALAIAGLVDRLKWVIEAFQVVGTSIRASNADINLVAAVGAFNMAPSKQAWDAVTSAWKDRNLLAKQFLDEWQHLLNANSSVTADALKKEFEARKVFELEASPAQLKPALNIDTQAAALAAREAERLRQEDLAGWVRYADAVFAEADKLNLDMEKIWDAFWKKEAKLRDDDIAGWVKAIDEQIKEYEKGLHELADKQPAHIELMQKQWLQLWGPISEAAGNFFGDLVVNGKSAFARLRDELKKFAADIIAFFAKRWILQMAAAATTGSLSSGLANAATSSATNSLAGAALSGAGSYVFGSAADPALILSSGGTQGLATSGLIGSGGFAATVGTAAGGLAEGLGASAASAAAFSEAVAAAIPVIGWIVAIGLILYSFFGHSGGGPKAGGSFLGAFSPTGALTADLTSGLDRSRFLHDETNQDSAARQLGEQIGQNFAQTLAAMGGTTTGLQLGIGWNRDVAGSAPSMVAGLVRDASGNVIYSHDDRNVGRSDQELATAIQQETERVIIAGLKASSLPPAIAAVFKDIDPLTASFEQLDAAIKKAVEIEAVIKGLEALGVKGLDITALQAWQRSGETISQTFQRVSSQFAAFDDAFMTESQKLAAAQTRVTSAFAELGIAVPSNISAFYDLVHGLDLSTETGRHLFDVLMAIAPAFATVTNAADQARANLMSTAIAFAGGASSAYGQQAARAALSGAIGNWQRISGGSWSESDVIGELGGLTRGGTAANPSGLSDAIAYAQQFGTEGVNALTAMLSAYTAWQQAMSQSSSSIPVATTSINDFTSAIDNSGAAAKQAADAMASAQQGIADWLAKTMLGQLSPLTPVDKLGFSHDRYVENLVAAQGRDLGALQGYTGIADEYLQQLASYYGVGSAEYMKGFAGVTGQAADLAGLSDARSVTAGDLKAGFKSVVDEVAKLRAEVGLLHDDQLHFRMMFERSSRTTAQQLTEAIRDGALGFG